MSHQRNIKINSELTRKILQKIKFQVYISSPHEINFLARNHFTQKYKQFYYCFKCKLTFAFLKKHQLFMFSSSATTHSALKFKHNSSQSDKHYITEPLEVGKLSAFRRFKKFGNWQKTEIHMAQPYDTVFQLQL